MSDEVWVGIFVGGQSRRMGGFPKGLLELPGGGRLIERLIAEVGRALPAAPIRLVGSHAAYAFLGLEAIPDDPPGIGPLGGFLGLLRTARGRGVTHLVVLSCDLPFVTSELIERLVAFSPSAAVVAPVDRLDGFGGEARWQPFFGYYRVEPSLVAAEALLATGARSLQRLFEHIEAPLELPLSDEERAQLRDWDTPEQVNS
ncbi:MAG: NTP transferase domain-containing protein [Polyangiaceae bacterium]|nr:NTP transferase domain-containing protein [Myxococcales bacterium]MCB9590806.1 NTP transferase domain-containing protein [Polyangiaceae bacterium]